MCIEMGSGHHQPEEDPQDSSRAKPVRSWRPPHKPVEDEVECWCRLEIGEGDRSLDSGVLLGGASLFARGFTG